MFTYLSVFLSALFNSPFQVSVNFTIMLLSHSSLWPSYLGHSLSLMHVCLSVCVISYLLFLHPRVHSFIHSSVAYYPSLIKSHEMSPYVPRLVVTFRSFPLFLPLLVPLPHPHTHTHPILICFPGDCYPIHRGLS